ncbi:MAG: hypothetical protein ACE14W_04070 [Candidatus Velamenicoccus archaeovorus]
MSRSSVYRTEQGRTIRITESDDGGLRVEQLEGEGWVQTSTRLAGLRLSPSTSKLSAKQVANLPP